MPAPGTKPKDTKHGHVAGMEWTEVDDSPFDGERPALPDGRHVEWLEWNDKRQTRRSEEQALRPETLEWWESVSTMPHCRLWSSSDWRFALATALIADMVFCGDRMAAGELRQREKIMGVTLDSRRDLRIRYRKPQATAAADATVTNLNTRRAALTAAG